jgi:hypothetical protein
MKTLMTAVIAFAFCHSALAGDSACLDQAVEKKLAGAAMASFMKKCARESCDTAGADKKLAGAARTSFTKKCVADTLAPYCEEQSAAKKLAGAARTSFLNKCQSGK